MGGIYFLKIAIRVVTFQVGFFFILHMFGIDVLLL